MSNQTQKDQNRAKKESLLKKHFSNLFLQLKINLPELEGLFINRVSLSRDKSVLHIYFYTDEGLEAFEKKFSTLVMYKPSLRKSLAQLIKSRYVPQLVFKYDKHFEKQCKMESLLNKIKEEEPL